MSENERIHHHATGDMCPRPYIGQPPIAKHPTVPDELTVEAAWELFELTGLRHDFERQASGHQERKAYYKINFSREAMKVSLLRGMTDDDLERIINLHQPNDLPADIL